MKEYLTCTLPPSSDEAKVKYPSDGGQNCTSRILVLPTEKE